MEVFTSSVKVYFGDVLMGSRRNEVGMLRAATDQVSKIDTQLLRFIEDLGCQPLRVGVGSFCYRPELPLITTSPMLRAS